MVSKCSYCQNTVLKFFLVLRIMNVGCCKIILHPQWGSVSFKNSKCYDRHLINLY